MFNYLSLFPCFFFTHLAFNLIIHVWVEINKFYLFIFNYTYLIHLTHFCENKWIVAFILTQLTHLSSLNSHLPISSLYLPYSLLVKINSSFIYFHLTHFSSYLITSHSLSPPLSNENLKFRLISSIHSHFNLSLDRNTNHLYKSIFYLIFNPTTIFKMF